MKTMKTLLVSAFTLLVAACSEATFEMHNTGFKPSIPGGMLFPADKIYDSIFVYSLDPWTINLQADNNWFECSPTSGEARPGTSALTRLDINVQTNNTGKNRKGYIVLKSYDNNTTMMPVSQNSWLDIVHPDPTYTGDTFEDRKAIFSIDLPSTVNTYDFIFHVYQNNATLTSDAEWITPATSTFNAGHQIVNLNIQSNPTASKRKATLTLTSGGVSTPIHVTQAEKKEKQ